MTFFRDQNRVIDGNPRTIRSAHSNNIFKRHDPLEKPDFVGIVATRQGGQYARVVVGHDDDGTVRYMLEPMGPMAHRRVPLMYVPGIGQVDRQELQYLCEGIMEARQGKEDRGEIDHGPTAKQWGESIDNYLEQERRRRKHQSVFTSQGVPNGKT